MTPFLFLSTLTELAEHLLASVRCSLALKLVLMETSLVDYPCNQPAVDGSIQNEALIIKMKCLRALAERQTSANGRNYYLTQLLEAEGLVLSPSDSQRRHAVLHSPLHVMFQVP